MTILIPTIGRFGNQKLDQFFDSHPAERARIQPTVVPLQTLADNPDKVRKHFEAAGEDINQLALTHVFKDLNNPKIPRPVQKFFVFGLRKVPLVGFLAESFHGCGLVSLPKKRDSDPEEESYYGSGREEIKIAGSTIKSLSSKGVINLVRFREDGQAVFCLSGTKEKIKDEDLDRFSQTFKQEAEGLVEEG